MKSARTLFSLLALLGAGDVQAESANVILYGTVNTDFEYASVPNDKSPAEEVIGRWRLVSNSANFGLKGIEEISENIKGIYQVELAINYAAGIQSPNLRNTGVGLTGLWGSVMAGKWDAPYKLVTREMDPWYAATAGFHASLIDTPGFNVIGADSASAGAAANVSDKYSFTRRQGTALWYWSPQTHPIQVKAMYAPNVNRSSSTGANPEMLSATLEWIHERFHASLAYENHGDFDIGTTALPYGGNNANSRDHAFRIAAAFKPTNANSFAAAWGTTHYRGIQPGQLGDGSYQKSGGVFMFWQKIADFTIRGVFSTTNDGSCRTAAGADCAVAGLGAQFVSFGTSFTLSKRTDLFLLLAKIWNENNAYDFSQQPAPTFTAGGDPQVIAFGVRHTF